MAVVTKIVKNTTVSTISLLEVGLDLQPSSSYTITVDEYLRWAAPAAITEITPDINAGDIVINDGTNDLAAADGIRFLEYADRAYIQKDDVDVTQVSTVLNFEGDVSVVDESNGKTTITIGEQGTPTGKLFDFLFAANGNTADKWLGVGNGSTSSDTLPLIIPWNGDLKALTFSNQDDNVDIDIEIYNNGSLIYTWNVRNKRTAWNTDLDNGIVSQGDRISMFMRKVVGGTGDSTAQDPAVEAVFSITGDNSGEGGTQYGV